MLKGDLNELEDYVEHEVGEVKWGTALQFNFFEVGYRFTV
jgi:hypothetical protein